MLERHKNRNPLLRILVTFSLLAFAVHAQQPGATLDAPMNQNSPATGPAAAVPSTGKPLTAWLTLGVEARGRLESQMGLKYPRGNDNTYYLHRLRLNFTIQPNHLLRIFIQAQDAQAPGLKLKPTSSDVDTMDLHQGYVEIGSTDKPWALRVGRQELRFGDSRLVGASSWSNVARSFDAVLLTYNTAGARVDWFAAALVIPTNEGFDRPHLNNGFYGMYGSFDRLVRNSVLEPYVLWKTYSLGRGELGDIGDQDVYTAGVRGKGNLPRRLNYEIETAFQVGHVANDRVRAWAGHWLLGHDLAVRTWKPNLSFEYNHASGDNNPLDGRRGTFDPPYASNHDKLGQVDRVTWRNINDLMAGVRLNFTRRWSGKLAYHYLWLATRQDALYNRSGGVLVLNRNATSSRVGPEIDVMAAYQATERLQFGVGYAHLFAGPYLRQSTQYRGATYPYLMWSYEL